jgi:photosystem II stability/assembly factor-like uncharacterized protein
VALVAVPARAQTPPPPPSTPWHWQNPLPHGNSLNAVSCPDASTCYAVGSGTAAVSPAPGRWTARLDKSLGTLIALSCPGSKTCYAISNQGAKAGAVLGTIDGGQSWTTLRPAGSSSLTFISCPGTTVCYATGEDVGRVFVTRDGGHTWSSAKVTFRPVDLSCPGDSVCYAPIDTSLIHSPPLSVAVSEDGGKTWTLRPVGVQGQLWGMRCAGVNTCSVVAFTGNDLGVPLFLRTTNSGRTWQRQAFPKNTYFRGGALACPTVATCYLAGDNGTSKGILLATSNAGKTWVSRKPLSTRPISLACRDRLRCVAVGIGDNVESTANGWVTWLQETRNVVRSLASLQTAGALRAITCPSAAVCYAAGDRSSFVVTSNAGAQWHSSSGDLKRKHLLLDLSTLACAGATTCFAGAVAQYPPGSGAETVSTRDGGKTWSATPGRGIAVVACPSTSICYAGGEKGAFRVSRDAGRTWTAEKTPLGAKYTIQRLTCPTTTRCYAGAIGPTEPPPHPESNVGALLTTADGGKTWTRTSTDPYPVALACRTATDCFALISMSYNSHHLVTHDGGRTWQPYDALSPYYWTSLTCVDASTCYATGTGVGTAGNLAVTHDGGTTWTAEATPTFNPLFGIACTGRDRCYAVGSLGTILARGAGG